MAKKKSLFHKLKTIIGYSVAAVVIIIALGISGLRFILTTANLYQLEVEQFASSLLEQPLKIGRMDAKLSGLVPIIVFHNVELLSPKTKKPLFSLSRIDVGLSFSDLVRQQKLTPTQLTVRGMNLNITRTVEGKLNVKGMDVEGLSKIENDGTTIFFEQWLAHQGEIALEDSTFTWKDEQNSGLTWFFSDINLLLKKTNERHQLSLSSTLPATLGDKVDLELDIVGDIRSIDTWDINAFVKSGNVNLKLLQNYVKGFNFEFVDGQADLALWFEWKNKNISRLSGDVEFTDFSYFRDNIEKVSLKRVSGIFDSVRSEDNIWNVSIDKFNYENKNKILNDTALSLLFKYSGRNVDAFHVEADSLKLNALSEIITDNHFVSIKNEEKIKKLSLNGDIQNLSIVLQNNMLSEFHADFRNVGVDAWRRIPQFDSLSGRLDYNNNSGIVSVKSKNSTIHFPNLFRNAFKVTDLSTDISFFNSEQGLLFDINHLSARNTEVDTETVAKLFIPKDGASPFLDMQIYVSRGDASKISQYLPVGIMIEPLVNWIDKGVLEGKVEKSTIVFNGKFNDFPFDKNEGAFYVNVEASDVVIDYQKNWPKITNANINGYFTDQGMKIALTSGELGENRIYNSQAEIKSFANPKLNLNVSAKSSVHETIQYLVNTPILSNAKTTVNSMRWLGYADTDIKINIPLDNGKNKISYSGSSELRDASLYMLKDKIDITEGSGKLFFTERKFSSRDLRAKILGNNAKLTVSSKNKDIYVSSVSKLEPSKLLERFSIPGANKISGSTTIKAVMTFPGNTGQGKKKRHPKLKVTSSLVGVKSNLPDNFYKPTNRRQNSTFESVFTGNKKNIFGLSFGEKGSAILEVDHSRAEPFLNKGAISILGKKATLPKRNVLYVDGTVKSITPAKWINALELGKKNNEHAFIVNPVVFNLNRLKIKTIKGSNGHDGNIIPPQKLPAFEGIINKFYFNETFLGRVDFKASKKKYGYHFDEIIISNENMKFLSNGDWRYYNGKHNTKFDITLSSSNFGGMLSNFGYKGIIEQGIAKTIGKINWSASPTQFSYAKLNGDIQLKLENGNIIDADAGAGRLLGFFSLSALPRKLLGDFKDTFKDGFNFDTAEGEIKIENGDAYTEDFEIESPVAIISISGRTGIVDKDYENIVEVVPKVGGGVAGLTALLVNLPAGIGLWLLDKITGEQFNEASSKTYEVSGDWKKPIFEEITEDE